jgi:hypothetical protein
VQILSLADHNAKQSQDIFQKYRANGFNALGYVFSFVRCLIAKS